MAAFLTVGVGDIHGRFDRVQGWLEALERAQGRTIDAVLAVGDVEAFSSADEHKRKAAKRTLPAEWSDYAAGKKSLHRPLYFIGGNNEDFEAVHDAPEGCELPGGARYLGRFGSLELGGVRVAFLSGIYAPKHYETTLVRPTTQATRKNAGYFREPEVRALEKRGPCDLLLLHEWPKGIVQRGGAGRRKLRAHRFPWIGNPVATSLVASLRPKWVMCGHSHVPYATTIRHPDGFETRVSALDQAAHPDGAIFWIEWERGEPVRAGWGTTGQVDWRVGDAWLEDKTPDAGTATSAAEAAPEPT